LNFDFLDSLEREIAKSEEKYRFLAENTTDVIWTMNMDFEFTYISPSVELLTRYTSLEVRLFFCLIFLKVFSVT